MQDMLLLETELRSVAGQRAVQAARLVELEAQYAELRKLLAEISTQAGAAASRAPADAPSSS